MNTKIFVKNVKHHCDLQGVKVTIACRDSGAGKDLINQLERRGSIPSVDRVQALAFFLKTTTSALLGETQPAAMDGLTDDERELIRIHDALPEDLRENLLSVARGLAMLPADGHTPAKPADAPASDAGSTGPVE